MGQEITIRCDQCGRLKQEANHWLMVKAQNHGFPSFEIGALDPTWVIWTEGHNGSFDKTFCGVPCFHRWQSKRLEELMK